MLNCYHLLELTKFLKEENVKFRSNFYSVLSRENSTVVITIFCIFCFEEAAHGLDAVSNNQRKFADVLGIRLPLNYSL